MLASLAAASVPSLVRLAAAFRRAAWELLRSICMTPKFPFLLSALPLSLLGTGFLTRPSLVCIAARALGSDLSAVTPEQTAGWKRRARGACGYGPEFGVGIEESVDVAVVETSGGACEATISAGVSIAGSKLPIAIGAAAAIVESSQRRCPKRLNGEAGNKPGAEAMTSGRENSKENWNLGGAPGGCAPCRRYMPLAIRRLVNQ